MLSRNVYGGLALALMMSLGCNNAADEQAKADKAQIEANEKIAQANREAQMKGAVAQAEADKKVAEAQVDFMKLREDYRHKINSSLTDLDAKVAELELKSKKEVAKGKVAMDARLADIRKQRAVVDADYKSLETTTAASWDAAKAKLDKEWEDLKSLVDKP